MLISIPKPPKLKNPFSLCYTFPPLNSISKCLLFSILTLLSLQPDFQLFITTYISIINRVYLTRNGHGQYAIIDMKELDELDKQKALYELMTKLNEAETSIREEGTISADELEAELGVSD